MSFIIICIIATFIVGGMAYVFIYKNNYLLVEQGFHTYPQVITYLLQERVLFIKAQLTVFFILLAILFIVGLYLSHKVAGPLYAFQRELKKICKGYYRTRLKLRPKDELKFLEKSFNSLSSHLDERQTRRENIYLSLKRKLAKALDDAPSMQVREEIIQVIESLQEYSL